MFGFKLGRGELGKLGCDTLNFFKYAFFQARKTLRSVPSGARGMACFPDVHGSSQGCNQCIC
jgi:hypothetical protein